MSDEIPYARLYAAYVKDRQEKGRPAMTEKEFKSTLEGLVKKDKEGFMIALEGAGWTIRG